VVLLLLLHLLSPMMSPSLLPLVAVAMMGMAGFNPAAVQLRKTNRGGASGGSTSHAAPAPKPAPAKYGGSTRSYASPAASKPAPSRPSAPAAQDNTAELLEDIQKLKARIEDLERENDDLRRENEELRAQAQSAHAAPKAAPAMKAAPAPKPMTPKAAPAAKPAYKKAAPAPAPKPAAPVPDGEPYKALYAFAGEQEGDLQFKKGDIIYVQKMSGACWEGTCNGVYGPFPSNYVAKA